jgi:hypothetical protein
MKVEKCICHYNLVMMYLLVGDKKTGIHHVYADFPAFHMEDNEFPNFLNLTGSFCPNFDSNKLEGRSWTTFLSVCSFISRSDWGYCL